jgi:hypothetical protein
MTAPRPAELLSGGADREPLRPPRAALVLLAVVAAVIATGVAVVALGLLPGPSADGPRPELAVLDDGIGVTTSGVIVLSVELRDRAAGLTVRSAELTAAPVLQPASVNAPARVRPGGTARLVAIVQPDCRALGPGEEGKLDATLVVGVTDASGRESDLRLDLGADRVLRGRLRGLCADGGSAQAGANVEFLTAGYDRVEAGIGVGASDGGDGAGAGIEVRAVEAPGLRFTSLGAPLPVRVAAGAGATLRVAVTVADCAAVLRPAAGSDPDAHVWGAPELEVVRADDTVTRVRPDPAAVSELYSTAVRRIVENGCDGPPR